MTIVHVILAAVLGLLAGAGVVAWLLTRQLQASREQVGSLETALNEQKVTVARLEEKAAQTERLQEVLDQAQADLQRFSVEAADLEARLQERAKSEELMQKSKEDAEALLKKAEEQLREAFEALSSRALQRNNQSFLDLAKAHLEAQQKESATELEKRKVAIDEMVKPLKEQLGTYTQKIVELEKERQEQLGGLGALVKGLEERQKGLESETRNLVHALRNPARRGQWGQLQLRRVVELAGMVKFCDFEEEVSQTMEDGRFRPDMIVRMPNDKVVVVDAKATLDAYTQAIEEPDDDKRRELYKRHVEHVRARMKDLRSKDYAARFKTQMEFVVMFLPGESIYSAALENDPELINTGVENNVILASPTTLIALLRAVAYGWRQVSLEQDAKRIAAEGQELLVRFKSVASHLTNVGKNLGRSVDAYNDLIGSIDRKLAPQLRKFEEFESLAPQGAVELPDPLEQSIRRPQSPEMRSLPGLDLVESDPA